MAIQTKDLIALIAPVGEGLKDVNELTEASRTHVSRLKIVGEKMHEAATRKPFSPQEWDRLVDEHFDAMLACYEDFQKTYTLYADIAQHFSDGMSSLRRANG